MKHPAHSGKVHPWQLEVNQLDIVAGTAEESLVHLVDGFLAFDFDVAQPSKLAVVAVGAVGLEQLEAVLVLAEVGTIPGTVVLAIFHLLQVFARYVFEGAV